MDAFFILFLFFLFYSIWGWIMEMVATSINTKKIVNRGFLIGPYCPIYGVSAIVLLNFLWKYEGDYLTLFVMSVCICSLIEYITSYIMEKVFRARWWDYTDRSFNVNGRICLTNSFAFGILGTVAISFVHPFLKTIVLKLQGPFFYILSTALLTIFVMDLIVSFNITFKLKKSFKSLKKDSTDEIKKKIMETINYNSKNIARVLNAFPNFRPLIKKTHKKKFRLFK